MLLSKVCSTSFYRHAHVNFTFSLGLILLGSVIRAKKGEEVLTEVKMVEKIAIGYSAVISCSSINCQLNGCDPHLPPNHNSQPIVKDNKELVSLLHEDFVSILKLQLGRAIVAFTATRRPDSI